MSSWNLPRPADLHSLPVLVQPLAECPDELQVVQASHALTNPTSNGPLTSKTAASKPAIMKWSHTQECIRGGCVPNVGPCLNLLVHYVQPQDWSTRNTLPIQECWCQHRRTCRTQEASRSRNTAHLCPLPMMPASRFAFVSATICVKRALSSSLAVARMSPISSNRSPEL